MYQTLIFWQDVVNLKDARRVKADLDDTIFAYDVNLKDARRVKADLDDTIFAYD